MVRNSMRRCLAFAFGIAVLALAGGARADGPFGNPVGPGYDYRFTEPFTWTGFYFGGHLGAGWHTGTLTEQPANNIFDADTAGPLGGIQLGYNYQIRTLVLGVEYDADWMSIHHKGDQRAISGVGTLQAVADTNWATSVAARFGIVGETWMAFFKVGEGWVNAKGRVLDRTTGAAVGASGTESGVLVGGGVEYGFTGNWIGRVEYDFIDLPNISRPGFTVGDRFDLDHNMQMLKFGISYRFCPC